MTYMGLMATGFLEPTYWNLASLIMSTSQFGFTSPGLFGSHARRRRRCQANPRAVVTCEQFTSSLGPVQSPVGDSLLCASAFPPAAAALGHIGPSAQAVWPLRP